MTRQGSILAYVNSTERVVANTKKRAYEKKKEKKEKNVQPRTFNYKIIYYVLTYSIEQF